MPRNHVLVLDRLQVRRRDHAGEQRIFAFAFEGAAVARLAADRLTLPPRFTLRPKALISLPITWPYL